MKNLIRVSLTAALVAAWALPAGADDSPAPRKAVVGKPAPDFQLKDLRGKTHRLSEYLKQGKVVVLEWFNPGCPFVAKHHQRFHTMIDLYAKYKPKGVVWLAINSGAPGKQGAGLEANRDAKKRWKIPYPILLDASGTVGRTYQARATPHMFVIDRKGLLRYAGAIDNNRSWRRLGDVNYVDAALTAVLAGKEVKVKRTRPYGCSVKYARRHRPTD